MGVQALRDEARRYRRLAKSIYNPAAAAELEALARALEEQAAQLETAQSLSRTPDPGA
jgi:hypothetical protein